MILGILNDGTGRSLAVEVKVPGNKATVEMLEFDNEIRRRGGHAGVATSVEEAQAIVQS
ncbi:MAG: hypothetical protein AB7V46_07500 [Thermomicrobiales bacterium]